MYLYDEVPQVFIYVILHISWAKRVFNSMVFRRVDTQNKLQNSSESKSIAYLGHILKAWGEIPPTTINHIRKNRVVMILEENNFLADSVIKALRNFFAWQKIQKLLQE